MSCAKMAEPIEMPFGIWTRVGPRKHVLGGTIGCTLGQPNTIAPSMCGGDAACCQITLTNCSLFGMIVLYCISLLMLIKKDG